MHRIWAWFSVAGIYCSGLDGFYSFFCNDSGIFGAVILPDLHGLLSIRVLLYSQKTGS